MSTALGTLLGLAEQIPKKPFISGSQIKYLGGQIEAEGNQASDYEYFKGPMGGFLAIHKSQSKLIQERKQNRFHTPIPQPSADELNKRDLRPDSTYFKDEGQAEVSAPLLRQAEPTSVDQNVLPPKQDPVTPSAREQTTIEPLQASVSPAPVPPQAPAPAPAPATVGQFLNPEQRAALQKYSPIQTPQFSPIVERPLDIPQVNQQVNQQQPVSQPRFTQGTGIAQQQPVPQPDAIDLRIQEIEQRRQAAASKEERPTDLMELDSEGNRQFSAHIAFADKPINNVDDFLQVYSFDTKDGMEKPFDKDNPEHVMQLQTLLRKEGVLKKDIKTNENPINGTFDAKTENALKNYINSHTDKTFGNIHEELNKPQRLGGRTATIIEEATEEPAEEPAEEFKDALKDVPDPSTETSNQETSRELLPEEVLELDEQGRRQFATNITYADKPINNVDDFLQVYSFNTKDDMDMPFDKDNPDHVEQLQERLVQKGLLGGRKPVDGKYGRKTEAALKKFIDQSGNKSFGSLHGDLVLGIAPTAANEASEKSKITIKEPGYYDNFFATYDPANLDKGKIGALQMFLAEQGINLDGSVEDASVIGAVESGAMPTKGLGKYGPRTKAGVKALQRKLGLKDTGKFDKNTIEAFKKFEIEEYNKKIVGIKVGSDPNIFGAAPKAAGALAADGGAATAVPDNIEGVKDEREGFFDRPGSKMFAVTGGLLAAEAVKSLLGLGFGPAATYADKRIEELQKLEKDDFRDRAAEKLERKEGMAAVRGLGASALREQEKSQALMPSTSAGQLQRMREGSQRQMYKAALDLERDVQARKMARSAQNKRELEQMLQYKQMKQDTALNRLMAGATQLAGQYGKIVAAEADVRNYDPVKMAKRYQKELGMSVEDSVKLANQYAKMGIQSKRYDTAMKALEKGERADSDYMKSLLGLE